MTTRAQIKYIEGSKGGCFPGDALVSTPYGDMPISDLKVGQKVIAFDHAGNLHEKKITKVVRHPEDLVYRIQYWGGYIDVTGNHWMLNQYNAFACASTFKPGEDSFVNKDGHLVPINSISKLSTQEVFNISVEDLHTFICDGVRVHNGGIGLGQFKEYIHGDKGGGKGGGGSTYVPREAPNTLKSVSIARVLDLISEGEIGGLVNGLKSIYFNDTPLQNDDDTFNFQGVRIDTRVGTPDQDYIEGFPAAESETAVGIKTTIASPTVRTITDSNANAISVKIRIPGLSKQETTGDLNGTSVAFKILRQSNGGGYTTIIDTVISGKNTSPYETSFRVPLDEGGAPWDIKVERVTPDAIDDATLRNEIYWSTYTKIIDNKLQYVDSALVSVEIDAEQFAEQIPSRAYEIYGIKVKIPSNYNPETRVYTGLWDGTFVVAWTDNPAWVLYDLLTNTRYGIGSSIDATQVDKFALYEIAKYCDGLVPDGAGGLEPRYTFNGVINTQEEAYKVLYSVASTFRGMLYFASGLVTAATDKDTPVRKIVTPANVIGGDFNYSGSSLTSKKSVAIVRYNDPNDGFRSGVVAYEDPEAIKQLGWKPEEMVAFGCTSKGQAYRQGKWYLETQNQSELVTYQCSFDQADLLPGEVIAVADPTYMGVRYGGRLVSATTSEVVIDAAVTLEIGVTYSLSTVLPDQTIETRDIVNVSDGNLHSILTLETELSDFPIAGAMWTLTSSEVEPRKFRVVSVAETDKHLYEVSAIIHDPTKYARVEEDIDLTASTFTLLPSGKLKPVSDISVAEYLYQMTNGQINNAVTLSWTASPDPRARYYQVEMMRPTTGFWEPVCLIQGTSTDLLGLVPGAYTFRIRAIDPLGGYSDHYTESFTILGLAYPPSDVQNFKINNLGPQSNTSWDHVPDLDLDYYFIKYSPKTVGASFGESTLLIARIAAGMTTQIVPTLIGTYFIKAVDKSGNESVNPGIIISNIGDLSQANVVQVLDETGFLGSKTNCAESSGLLRLVSLSSLGYYYFDNDFDLGDVYTSRIIPSVNASGEDLSDVMDTWLTLDSLEYLSTVDPGAWSARVQVRTTEDDPTASPTWTEWGDVIIGDYTCRAFEFRLVLESLNENTTPVVAGVQVTIDMEDRVERGNDIVTTGGTGIKSITYAYPFKEMPALNITAQGMQPGDTFDYNTKDESGFEVYFLDSSNNPITRTFDYVASGYGRKLP